MKSNTTSAKNGELEDDRFILRWLPGGYSSLAVRPLMGTSFHNSPSFEPMITKDES